MSSPRIRVPATRVATAAAVGLLLALLSAVLFSTPSQADPEKLQVSTGASGPWADNLTRPLFGDAGPFVPLDAVPDRFYLRNNSQQPARATLSVVDRGASNAFEQRVTFTTVVGGVVSDVPVAVDGRTKCRSYVTGPSIPAGGVQPVDVILNFADVPGQTAMDLSASVDFVLTLSQVGPKGKVDICGAQAIAEPYTRCQGEHHAVVTVLGDTDCPQVKGVSSSAASGGSTGGAGLLPGTGAPRGVGAVAGLAVALILTGVALVATRRRLQEQAHGETAAGPRQPLNR